MSYFRIFIFLGVTWCTALFSHGIETPTRSTHQAILAPPQIRLVKYESRSCTLFGSGIAASFVSSTSADLAVLASGPGRWRLVWVSCGAGDFPATSELHAIEFTNIFSCSDLVTASERISSKLRALCFPLTQVSKALAAADDREFGSSLLAFVWRLSVGDLPSRGRRRIDGSWVFRDTTSRQLVLSEEGRVLELNCGGQLFLNFAEPLQLVKRPASLDVGLVCRVFPDLHQFAVAEEIFDSYICIVHGTENSVAVYFSLGDTPWTFQGFTCRGRDFVRRDHVREDVLARLDALVERLNRGFATSSRSVRCSDFSVQAFSRIMLSPFCL